MIVYYCRLISKEYTPDAETQIKSFVQAISSEAEYQPFAPYWKDSKMGELSIVIPSEKSLSEMQSLFADCWQEDTADARWSRIFCPQTAFIWLSH